MESLKCQYYKYHTDDDLLYLFTTYEKLEVILFVIRIMSEY